MTTSDEKMRSIKKTEEERNWITQNASKNFKNLTSKG